MRRCRNWSENEKKIDLHIFGFEAKTLVLVAPVPGHCLPFTFYLIDFNTFPVDSYKINVSLKFGCEISMVNTLLNRSNDSNYFQTGSGPASLLSLYLNRVIKRVLFAFAKTKAQISCAITVQLINGFFFAT